jgi:hypothetical protein
MSLSKIFEKLSINAPEPERHGLFLSLKRIEGKPVIDCFIMIVVVEVPIDPETGEYLSLDRTHTSSCQHGAPYFEVNPLDIPYDGYEIEWVPVINRGVYTKFVTYYLQFDGSLPNFDVECVSNIKRYGETRNEILLIPPFEWTHYHNMQSYPIEMKDLIISIHRGFIYLELNNFLQFACARKFMRFSGTILDVVSDEEMEFSGLLHSHRGHRAKFSLNESHTTTFIISVRCEVYEYHRFDFNDVNIPIEQQLAICKMEFEDLD